MDSKPWWWPELADDEWRDRLRKDYPEKAGWSDERLDDYFNENGCKYVDTWDHLGDARAHHDKLADAFLNLCAETGKKPEDFV